MESVYSAIPEVWVNRCRTVMSFHAAPPSGSHLLILSSRLSRACSVSITTAAAVNCFPREPDWYTVLSLAGTPSSTLARPYPRRSSTLSFRTTAMETPGMCCRLISAVTYSSTACTEVCCPAREPHGAISRATKNCRDKGSGHSCRGHAWAAGVRHGRLAQLPADESDLAQMVGV